MQILPDEEAEILKEHWEYEPLEEATEWTTLTNCTVEDFHQSVLMHPSVMSMKPHFGSRFNSSVFDEFNNDYSNMNLHSNGENIKKIKLSKSKNKRVVYSCATIKDSRKKMMVSILHIVNHPLVCRMELVISKLDIQFIKLGKINLRLLQNIVENTLRTITLIKNLPKLTLLSKRRSLKYQREQRAIKPFKKLWKQSSKKKKLMLGKSK